MSKYFEVKFVNGSSGNTSTVRVQASSAAQAKEQIKSKFHNAPNFKIISAVEK
ncbi:hypothetical protein IRM71_02910 [Erwinia amylovora]|uniref:hypothetical protein n=1 Tax=Erwinia TaxID=551 RepID=UPI0001C12EB4|nr:MULTISPECIES: hypothetical protein [Erwinia]CCP05930.1 hypothetical protein BN440_0879 [Erwinia amylovora MR1]UDJ86321.1 hypothetical protein IRM68_14980 [Erwinia amylovora]UDJ97781.1 hypothetical protein IRM69_10910 [Erwinia amylovora]UDK90160.1 hypothetical protein IRM70_02915 [Erwinia amylovora]UDK93551.1 hypothetical protein IRM71_02910 [Erwinia amylovora]